MDDAKTISLRLHWEIKRGPWWPRNIHLNSESSRQFCYAQWNYLNNIRNMECRRSFFSIFSSGHHFVWRCRAVMAIMVEGLIRNIFVKLL